MRHLGILRGKPHSHASLWLDCQSLKIRGAGRYPSISSEEAKAIKAGLPTQIFWARDIVGKTDWIDDAINGLSDHVYLTIDIDGLDPSIMPTTGTPEPGGLGWYETLSFIRQLAEQKQIVGMDLVEYSYVENNDPLHFYAHAIYNASPTFQTKPLEYED